MAPARTPRAERRIQKRPSVNHIGGNEESQESQSDCKSSEDSLDARKLAKEMSRDVRLR